MRKKIISFALVVLIGAGCASPRDLSSPHYLPPWENRLFSVPSPSETSAGYWAVKAAHGTGKVLGHLLLFPIALGGNLLINAWFIVSWPVRWPLHGDKRLIVWYPLFSRGEKAGSRYFSKEWNEDLS